MKTNYTYIKLGIPGYYFNPEEPLTEENCDVLGTTYEDFLNGKFVPLNEEQITFSEENPNASIKEIFDMQLIEHPVYVKTLEEAIQQKIQEINMYDTSSNVNGFYLNGMQVWLDKDTRVGLMNSLTIEKNSGKETSTLWFNDICININCDAAIQMLSSLELYALECYNRTAEHRVNVKGLEVIEDVDGYDYTEGYPEKLSFNV